MFFFFSTIHTKKKPLARVYDQIGRQECIVVVSAVTFATKHASSSKICSVGCLFAFNILDAIMLFLPEEKLPRQ